jgi:hypothetical protein
MGSIILSVVTFLIGCALTHWYANRAGRDMRQRFDDVTARLDRLQSVLEGGEKAGTLKLDRDAKGEITSAHILTIDTGKLGLTGHSPTLIVGSDTPTAGNAPTVAGTPP